MTKEITPMHPVETEMSLLGRSVALAETAISAVSMIKTELKKTLQSDMDADRARYWYLILGAARMDLAAARLIQEAARQSLRQRLAAPKLVAQEAKMIESAANPPTMLRALPSSAPSDERSQQKHYAAPTR